MSVKIKFLLLIVFAASLISAFFLLGNKDYLKLERSLKASFVLFDENKPLPKLELTDLNNQPFSNNDLKGHWSIVFFGFTFCPDVCPTGLMDMVKLKKILQTKKLQNPEIIFITLDPNRDTPEVLKDYVTYFDKDFKALTGTKEHINQIIKPFGTFYEVVLNDGENQKTISADDPIPNDIKTYTLNHTAWMYLISPDGEIFAGLPTPHNPSLMAEDIEKIFAFY
jgi:protein SCO1/2